MAIPVCGCADDPKFAIAHPAFSFSLALPSARAARDCPLTSHRPTLPAFLARFNVCHSRLALSLRSFSMCYHAIFPARELQF